MDITNKNQAWQEVSLLHCTNKAHRISLLSNKNIHTILILGVVFKKSCTGFRIIYPFILFIIKEGKNATYAMQATRLLAALVGWNRCGVNFIVVFRAHRARLGCNWIFHPFYGLVGRFGGAGGNAVKCVSFPFA